VSDLHPDLDPATGALLSFLAAAGAPPMWEQTPEEARQGFRTLAVDLRDDSLLPPVRAVEEIEVPGGAGPRPARVYRPEHDGPLPTVLFLHGGGFVIGDLDTHDLACRTIATESRAVVVSVDYRLAPEHPFPAAVEDTLAAADWMVGRLEELGGSDRTGVAGDSAGGNLAAVAAQHLPRPSPRARTPRATSSTRPPWRGSATSTPAPAAPTSPTRGSPPRTATSPGWRPPSW
jgi:acetyl esterase